MKSVWEPIETERLIIRNWQEKDRDLFFEINSDEKVMRFFPFTRNRKQSNELFERIQETIARTGYGFTALELKQTGKCIGFTGLAECRIEPVFKKSMVEIGWRLATNYWGMGYATEAATACLKHGFESRKLNEIVSFAVHSNKASFAVMKRIGMRPDPARDYDHPRVPDSRPELKRHLFYAITRKEWKSGK